jgi:ribosomal protein S27E
MHEGYCVKCKAKKPIGDATEETMKNGRKAVKGKCQTCGAVMVKILGGKTSAPSDSVGLSVAPSVPPSAPTATAA